MQILRHDDVANNTCWAAPVGKGNVLRITATSVVSLVCFNAADLNERFDQARTKVYNMRLWISAGEQLFSKLNNPMMTVVVDQFAGLGRHDLQFGMCSGSRSRSPSRGEENAVPDHGCLENLVEALTPWGIVAHHIPMPLNLFLHTEIDTVSGAIRPVPVRPPQPVAVEFRAEMDLVLALSACPDLEMPTGGGPAEVAILAPSPL